MSQTSATVHELRPPLSASAKVTRWFDSGGHRLVVPCMSASIVAALAASFYFFIWKMPEVSALSEHATARYASEFNERGLRSVTFWGYVHVFIETEDADGSADPCNGECTQTVSPLGVGPFTRFSVARDEAGRLHVRADVDQARQAFSDSRDRFDRAMAIALERYDQRGKALDSWKAPSVSAAPARPASGNAVGVPMRP